MVRKENSVESGKKRYTTPRLIHHGDVDEITQKNGLFFTDIPIGTPVGADTRPGGGPPS